MDAFLPIVWWVGGGVAALAVLVVVVDKIRRHVANKKLAQQLLDYEERHRKATAWPGSVTVEELDKVTFSAVTFHEGYETAEVDNLLTHVREALEAHERGTRFRLPDGILVSAEIPEIRFSTTQYREGYHKDEVNEFVERIRETLYRYEEGRGEFAFPRKQAADPAHNPAPAPTVSSDSRTENATVAASSSSNESEVTTVHEPHRKPRFKILPGHVDTPRTGANPSTGHIAHQQSHDIDDRRTGSWG